MIHKGPVGKPFTEKATYFLIINMDKISKKKKKERKRTKKFSFEITKQYFSKRI